MARGTRKQESKELYEARDMVRRYHLMMLGQSDFESGKIPIVDRGELYSFLEKHAKRDHNIETLYNDLKLFDKALTRLHEASGDFHDMSDKLSGRVSGLWK